MDARRLLLGYEDSLLEFVLAELSFAEQAVVMAESLVRRLPGCPSIAASIMAHAIEGTPADEEQGLGGGYLAPLSPPKPGAGSLHAAAGSLPSLAFQAGAPAAAAGAASSSFSSAPPPAVLRIYRPLTLVHEPAARLGLAALVCPSAALSMSEQDAGEALALGGPERAHAGSAQQPSPFQQQGAGAGHGVDSGREQLSGAALPPRARALMQRLLEPHWPQPAHREWVISAAVARAGEEGPGYKQQGAGSEAAAAPPGLCSRMYVQQAEGEMRIATVLVSDPA